MSDNIKMNEQLESSTINIDQGRNVLETRTDAEALLRRHAACPTDHTRDRLVVLHANLVRFLAGKFANRGEPIEDLIQVATIGLINAIDRFEPDRGLKFSTFATPTIVGEIRRYFRDKTWSLKVPRRMQELSQLTSKVRESLTNKLGRTPTVAEIASACEIPEEDVLHALEVGAAYETVSFDTPVSQESDSSSASLADVLGSADEEIVNIQNYGDLDAALNQLDSREQAVIIARYFKELSQADVATAMNMSQMHISRIQKQALKKLKTFIEQSN